MGSPNRTRHDVLHVPQNRTNSDSQVEECLVMLPRYYSPGESYELRRGNGIHAQYVIRAEVEGIKHEAQLCGWTCPGDSSTPSEERTKDLLAFIQHQEQCLEWEARNGKRYPMPSIHWDDLVGAAGLPATDTDEPSCPDDPDADIGSSSITGTVASFPDTDTPSLPSVPTPSVTDEEPCVTDDNNVRGADLHVFLKASLSPKPATHSFRC